MMMLKKNEILLTTESDRAAFRINLSVLKAVMKNHKKKKRKTLQDSYGTINWPPVNLPGEETKESQKERIDFLICKFSKEIRDIEKVKDHMLMMFASQRFFISEGKISVIDIQREWPFLLEVIYTAALSKLNESRHM